MRLTKRLFAAAGVVVAVSLFFSCGSTATLDGSSKKASAESKQDGSSGGITEKGSASTEHGKLPPAPKKLTEAPRFDFSGSPLKIELENMYYDGFDLVGDANASGSYALRLLGDTSWAVVEVNFPAGSYEGLVNVLAPDSSHSRFNVCINSDTFLVYGSEPPIGKYELTTRAPVSFTLDAPSAVTVRIQQNDIRNPAGNGQNGMTLDYITFKKR